MLFLYFSIFTHTQFGQMGVYLWEQKVTWQPHLNTESTKPKGLNCIDVCSCLLEEILIQSAKCHELHTNFFGSQNL